MEKKFRDIVVDNQKYGWTIYGGGKEQYIQVWKDKRVFLSTTFRVTSVTPKDIEELIKEHNDAVQMIELRETLDKEWTAFLRKIPWDGYGNTIEESNIIFDGKRRAWMKKMKKKHSIDIALLEKHYVHD